MNNLKDLPQLPSSDLFTDEFDRFKETKLFSRLQSKFTPLPYYSKYRSLRWIALIASYLFNAFSAITASTLIFFFTKSLTGNLWFSALCTFVFIFLIEIAKRKTNSIFFKDYLQFKKLPKAVLSIIFLLLCISVSFSFFGSKKMVSAFHAPPVLIQNDTLTKPLIKELSLIDSQIKSARKTKWKGTTTSTSQKTIESLSKQKLAIQKRLFNIETNTEIENKEALKSHENTVYLKAENFAIVTLFLELLFILCAFYLEYYDYRSFAEFAIPDTNCKNAKTLQITPSNRITNTVRKDIVYTSNDGKLVDENITAKPLNINHESNDNNDTSRDAITKAIKHVKSRISTYQYKLRNNIGRPETAIENLDNWTKELNKLKAQL